MKKRKENDGVTEGKEKKMRQKLREKRDNLEGKNGKRKQEKTEWK